MKQYSSFHILFLITIIIIFISCEKIVEFKIDTQENKLVVNCLFGPDEDVDANISLSIDPLSINEEIVYLDDATIKFFKNGDYLGDFIYNDSSYIFDKDLFTASASDLFKIEVSAPGKETVTAETTIPAEVELTGVEIIDTIYQSIFYSIIDSLGNVIYIDSIVPFYQFEIAFDDAEGLDYYSLEIIYKDAFSSTYTCFTTSDPTFIFESSYDFGGEEVDEVTLCSEVFFSDLTFDGTTKKIQLSLLQIATEFTPDPKFIFKLKHLSEDYYKYISTTDLQYGANDDPFAEPVIVFSNIENGFGIFAGYSISEVEVEL